MSEFEGGEELTQFVIEGLNALAQSLVQMADVFERLIDIGTAILPASAEPDRNVDGDDE